ncbi:hypothetical protein QYE76_033744 [Lolium multiflorum]|uniref:Uncharacterized protein n=1 Tax=Lolium multiflorum TaxID=4521 RepID=A0AAD8VLU0_LOLMU|nr:hypothetical protein QYE76_033744 [Lolium multiflorum]
MARPRHHGVWGPHNPSRLLFFALLRPEDLSHRGYLTKVTATAGRRTPERKSSPAGRNPPGKFLEGEIDAIAIVIELDIISIIIIIISTIYTAITTAAPRHRCNDLDCLNRLEEDTDNPEGAEDIYFEEPYLSRGVEGVDYLIVYGASDGSAEA